MRTDCGFASKNPMLHALQRAGEPSLLAFAATVDEHRVRIFRNINGDPRRGHHRNNGRNGAVVSRPRYSWWSGYHPECRRSRRLAILLRIYYGPEYVSQALQQWANGRGIRLESIQPGKPQQNAHVERFNHTLRYDCSHKRRSRTLQQLNTRPRKTLDFLTPAAIFAEDVALTT
jgi:hypothetical protein